MTPDEVDAKFASIEPKVNDLWGNKERMLGFAAKVTELEPKVNGLTQQVNAQGKINDDVQARLDKATAGTFWPWFKSKLPAVSAKAAGQWLILGLALVLAFAAWNRKPAPPAPTDPIGDKVEALQQSVDLIAQGMQRADETFRKFDQRITKLELTPPLPVPPGPTPVPVPPTDPFGASLQAAYNADGKPSGQLDKLVAVYRNSDLVLSDPNLKVAGDVTKAMHLAIQARIGDDLRGVRRVVADELNKTMSKLTALDQPTKNVIAVQFLRVQVALEGLK